MTSPSTSWRCWTSKFPVYRSSTIGSPARRLPEAGVDRIELGLRPCTTDILERSPAKSGAAKSGAAA
ncbi:hypothetical protein [Kribbella sp. NPDC048915]|uniref:hypothetical protein n=1 Tax=Kribbella sp. NPDC048915 TaxID=3155148 RepID=UPI00340DBFCE